MKQELQERLFAKYPDIFQDRTKSMQETCMCWGIDTGDGWFDLLDITCGQIQWYIHNRTENVRYAKESAANGNPWSHAPSPVPPQVVADQVKDKFGGLRFYYHGGDEFIEGVISLAEEMSMYICEQCGNKGVCSAEHGWVRTECDRCKEDRLKKRSGGI